MSGPGTPPSTATPVRAPWWRWAFALPGLLAVGYGALGLLTAGNSVPLSAWVTWFLGSALLHDVVLAPIWIAAGWLTSRFLPAAARPALVVGGAVIGLLTLVALPFVLAPGRDPANPSFLPRDYGRNLLLVDAAVLLLTAAWAVTATRRRRRSLNPAAPRSEGRPIR